MALTAWAQEEKAKREAWYEINRLKKRIAELAQEKTNLRHRIDELTEVGNTLKQALIDQDHYATLEHDERYIDAIGLLNVGDV